ncbi:MAG: type II toxin-antitoxin system RelE/ParE family toxin [Trueperaceae bacterium]|nr:MAG: type II toxin-antitoxin system RelE/ParE family toxin [Trueperaceae bacterium]
MPFYRKSPEAEADLLRIWRYIASDSRQRATQFIDELHGVMGMLADVPGAGRPRDDLIPDLRGFPVAGYLIFYRELAGGIEVVRVLSSRRDLRRIFTEQ